MYDNWTHLVFIEHILVTLTLSLIYHFFSVLANKNNKRM